MVTSRDKNDTWQGFYRAASRWDEPNIEITWTLISDHVRYLVQKHYRDRDLQAIREDVWRDVDRGVLNAAVNLKNFCSLITDPLDSPKTPYFLLSNYVIIETIAIQLNTQGKPLEARSMLTLAALYAGQLDFALEFNNRSELFKVRRYEQDKARSLAALPQSGGKAKSSSIADARQHLLKLLNADFLPKENLTNRESIAEAYKDEFIKFITENNIPLSTKQKLGTKYHPVVRNLINWMGNAHPEIKHAALEFIHRRQASLYR